MSAALMAASEARFLASSSCLVAAVITSIYHLISDQKQATAKTLIIPPAKISLDKISEGSETYSMSRSSDKSDKSEPTYKEKTEKTEKSRSKASSAADDDKTEEEIVEEISAATEPSEDRSQEIKIDLHTKTKEDIYDVSYTDDTFEHFTESAAQRLPLSARSYTQFSEIESKNQPLSARSESEQISEQISEALPTASMSVSESFIKPLDLKAMDPEQLGLDLSEKSEKEVVSDLDNSPRSNAGSSRPSSGERSIMESSESEKLPVDKVPKSDKDEVGEEINEPSWLKKRTGGLISNAMTDIDDLLGLPSDEEIEEETPVQSPAETPREVEDTPRDEVVDDALGERQAGDGEPHAVDLLQDHAVGDRVSVTGLDGDRCAGILLYKGEVKFAPGIWAGVELDSANGRHDGMEAGDRYFTCRDNHGLLVPGDDVMAAPEEQEPMLFNETDNVRDSIESVKSVTSVMSENDELMKAISESDKLVQQFMEDSPVSTPRNEEPKSRSRNELLADRIAEDLFQSVLKENVNTISKIASKQKDDQKRKAPPVAPKPKRTHDQTPSLHNGDLDDLEAFLQPDQAPQAAAAATTNKKDRGLDDSARETANTLMNDAIDHMLSIRHNRQNQDKDHSRDSGNFTDGVEEDQHDAPVSPTEELKDVLDKQEEDLMLDTPPRPGSPIPGLKSHTVSVVGLNC